MMNIALLTQVHAQDTPIARIDSKKSTKSVSPKKLNTNAPAELSSAATAVTASPAFDLTVVRKNADRSVLNKVGPNGEDLILKKNKYFYFNEKGKKIKVRNSSLRDRPKHS